MSEKSSRNSRKWLWWELFSIYLEGAKGFVVCLFVLVCEGGWRIGDIGVDRLSNSKD